MRSAFRHLVPYLVVLSMTGFFFGCMAETPPDPRPWDNHPSWTTDLTTSTAKIAMLEMVQGFKGDRCWHLEQPEGATAHQVILEWAQGSEPRITNSELALGEAIGWKVYGDPHPHVAEVYMFCE